MHNSAISRHNLERRHAALKDMLRYLAEQERDFNRQRTQLQAFSEHYQALLGPLYKELNGLEAQLRLTTDSLLCTLKSRGIELGLPDNAAAAQRAQLPEAQMPHLAQMGRFSGLPPASPLPPVPQGADIAQWAPPTLKMLYRRAAMRIHPDRASSEANRVQREQLMMAVNAAYAAGERWRLEAMLLAAGEDPSKVNGGHTEALHNWLSACENQVQNRLRLVNDYLSAIAGTGIYKLWCTVTQAQARGLDLLGTMALKLRAQIVERRKELYISTRLNPESSLARAFLHQRIGRFAGAGQASSVH